MRGVGSKLAVFQAPSCRFMDDLALLRAAGFRIHAPALGCSCDQHDPRRRACLAQRLPATAHRVRISGRLHAEQRIGIEFFVRRRVLQAHLLQVHFELFSDQHRDRGIGALPHLDIGHGQNHLAVAADADEGVRCKVPRSRRFALAEWQAQAQYQASTKRSGTGEEPAPRQAGIVENARQCDRDIISASLCIRLRGKLDRLADTDISPAAADIPAHGVIDIGIGRDADYSPAAPTQT